MFCKLSSDLMIGTDFLHFLHFNNLSREMLSAFCNYELIDFEIIILFVNSTLKNHFSL